MQLSQVELATLTCGILRIGASTAGNLTLTAAVNGAGHFTTLKVRDFVKPGDEGLLKNAHLFRTRNGYSFMALNRGGSRLNMSKLIATRPYRRRGRSGGAAPGDFDGDGKTDVTVFRPSTGIWYVRNVVTGI